MDVNSLDKLINNMSLLFEAKNYKEFLRQSTFIHGYEFINSMIIYFQNTKATDVKCELAWAEFGRTINEVNNPIWVIIPVHETSYIENESKEAINISGLTTDEINKAIEFGVITRTKELVKFKTTIVYDIKDTRLIDKSKKDIYEQYNKKENIKISKLCSIADQLLNIKSVKGYKTYYDKDNNILYIGDELSIDKVTSIIKIIVYYMVEKLNGVNEIITDERLDNTVNLKPEYKKMIEESVLYTIYNYLNISINYEFDYVKNIYGEISNTDKGNIQLIEIMNSIINIVCKIVNNFKEEHQDAETKLVVMKKAETLLDIMEANNARLMIKLGVKGD